MVWQEVFSLLLSQARLGLSCVRCICILSMGIAMCFKERERERDESSSKALTIRTLGRFRHSQKFPTIHKSAVTIDTRTPPPPPPIINNAKIAVDEGALHSCTPHAQSTHTACLHGLLHKPPKSLLQLRGSVGVFLAN